MSEPEDSVAFIVTVYNKQSFLPAVLAAIARQTGDFAREYVFVDDGSTDQSLECLRDLTASWRNCRIISQPNQGASRAMNVAVCHATARYLKLVDADDLLAPHATEWLLIALRQTRAVLAAAPWGFYDPGRSVAWPTSATGCQWDFIADPLRMSLRNSTTNPSCMLLARDDYLRIGGADESVCCQDYSLVLPLSRIGPFVRLKDPVVLTPTAAPGRLSDNKARELHDVTRALGHFVQEADDLSRADKNYAVLRASTRAGLWARRHGRAARAIRYYLTSLRTRLGLVNDAAGTILRCCGAYDYDPPIPIRAGERRVSMH